MLNHSNLVLNLTDLVLNLIILVLNLKLQPQGVLFIMLYCMLNLPMTYFNLRSTSSTCQNHVTSVVNLLSVLDLNTGTSTSYFSAKKAFIASATLHAHYKGSQLSHMVEELNYILIVIMGEHATAAHVSIRGAVHREIVHALVVGACAFTDLVKRVVEHLVDNVCFEGVLSEVARFPAPEYKSFFRCKL
ncbi:hypothetical protein K438DRAFT_1994411 [Mycena galopus ATCC 62051]|nr:hypothetical protein K438DRAFT_1994411 [Mycena galopus ATCC 62051]